MWLLLFQWIMRGRVTLGDTLTRHVLRAECVSRGWGSLAYHSGRPRDLGPKQQSEALVGSGRSAVVQIPIAIEHGEAKRSST